MTKNDQRKARLAYKLAQKEAFLASLPMPEESFRELFDYLDEQLGEQDCQHDLRLTQAFLAELDCDAEAVLRWLCDNGGGCDCEVLNNVEERFDN